MNKSRSLLIAFLLPVAGWTGLQAQEVISAVPDNPRAVQQWNHFHTFRKATAALLELPLFDDFSNSPQGLDPSIWSDAFAFVNNNFADHPLTNGVATLDALDEVGSIYAQAVWSPNTFEADHLTSQPVNLAYPVSDSIYLSFLYQPGGLCDLPEVEDSLLVDFWASDSSRWINVWATPGTALHPFRTVMIPVVDPRFLNNEFRFRFRNYASLPRNNETPDKRSNVDYWHVDYIRLGRNRFAADTVLRDVAFNRPLTSIFKELTAVPWSHFENARNTTLASVVTAWYRNNDTIARNVTRSLTIQEPMYGESEQIGIPTAQDIPAMDEMGVDFAFPYDLDLNRGDSALIRFIAALRTDEFDPKVNDTVVHDQLFRDYYAYDDGTAEAGYGLRGDGTEYGMVAIRHHAYKPDMLGGVYIFFNQVYDSLNLKQYTFNLMVWNDAGGIPGTPVWDDETIYKPMYTPTYSGFVKYEFTEPVPVNGTFYVGWRQYKPYTLNMGLDLNNKPASPHMFFNLGSWLPSQAPGTVLFRPFMYDPLTGEERGPENGPGTLSLYPNPASDHIWIELPPGAELEPVRLSVFDSSGRQIQSLILRSGSLDVSSFEPGLYFVRALIAGHAYYSKILINR